MNNVDFSYAFARPYAMTFCEPMSSNKYLAYVFDDKIEFGFAEKTPREVFPLAWETIRLSIKVGFTVYIDGEKIVLENVKRTKSGIPKMEISTNDGRFSMECIASKKGLIVKNVFKSDEAPFSAEIIAHHIGGWVISNQGHIDGVNNNLLLKMNDGRADKMVAYATGADEYPINLANSKTQKGVPMPEMEAQGISPRKAINMSFNLEKDTSKTAYLYLPFNNYFEELEEIKNIDFEKEMAAAEKKWLRFLNRGAKIYFADEGVKHCYNACLSDLYVMHDTFKGGKSSFVCGTNEYRCANSGEPMLAVTTTDILGFSAQALKDSKLHIEGQDDDGCWATKKGWEHEMWGWIFFKAFFVHNHYMITKDIDYLRTNYKYIKASTLYNGKARETTRTDKNSSHYGFMPFGMGDCGMMDGGEFYGYYYPHNFLAIGADKISIEIANILGEAEDAKVFTKIYEDARRDILKSLNENYVTNANGSYIPATPTGDETSMFGCLFGAHPTKVLPYDNELIRKTVEYVYKKGISEGGLPVGTGWQKDGLWVAMALDNFSQSFLRFGMYEEAASFLYPTLNHASPLVTWCEERGVGKGDANKTGDTQHLWTPLAFVSYIASAYAFDDEDVLHITAGLPKEWYKEKLIADVKGIYTYSGKTDFKLSNLGDKIKFTFKSERNPQRVVVHYLDKNDNRCEFEIKNPSSNMTTEISL